MPDWTADLRRRLASLNLSPTRETEIVEELSQHLDDRWRELVAGGASPEEATDLALADFTDPQTLARLIAPLKQAHQPPPITPGAATGRVAGDLWLDLRYAVRTMTSRPGFTLVAVLSLALGVGANTAIFSLWNGVLRAPLPGVDDPGQLVMLSNPADSGSWTGTVDGVRSWLTYEEFEQLRDRATSFTSMMASQSSLSSWQARFEGDGPEDVSGRLVSGGFFQVLGVGAAVGRVFTPADDRNAAPEAVISHGYWQRRFGGRPGIVGRTFAIRKATFTIIGVAAKGFVGETSGQQPDVWFPVRLQPTLLPGRDRLHDAPPDKSMWLHVFGRLKPGVTHARAEAEANAIFQGGLESFYGAEATGPRRRELLNQLLQIREGGRGASSTRYEFSESLTALLAGVGVLLLIACANLANLLLARGTARQPEIALRLSLGASRGRLVRQLVTESLVLAVMGAAAALAVAAVLHGALVQMMVRSDEDFRMAFTLDPQVLAFVLASMGAATLLFGVLPAWQVTRTDVGAGLQGRGTVGRFGQLRTARLLVSLQLALSLPLLVGAGLMARTLVNLQRVNLGFPPDHLLLARVDMREAGDGARRLGLVRELQGEIQQVPGVRAASVSQLGLFTGGESSTGIEVEGYMPRRDEDRESALDVVGPGYFSTLGTPIALGRGILESDQAGAPRVCVVNEAFAARFFEGRNPIGLRISTAGEADRVGYQVVGVAKNIRMQGLRSAVSPRYYVAAAQRPSSPNSPTFLIRTNVEPASLAEAVRRTIQRLDAALPIMSVVTMEEQMAPLTAQDRTVAQLAVVFGTVALALAAIGLYGVLSYGIARRTGEIAIRIALGAYRGRVIGMILRETLAVVGVGLVVGSVLAFATARLIDSRLVGVASGDPLTLVLATALLLLVAIGAAYIPANRASRLDPMTALRT